jgi:hypothetical protein
LVTPAGNGRAAELRALDEWLFAVCGRVVADLGAAELARLERLCREWPEDTPIIPAAAVRAVLDSVSIGEPPLPPLPPELKVE